ncbi:MAG: hypothetical protein V4760_13730 [Bdellovibrionota bacterium]
MAGGKVQIKKVKAYPFPATIKLGTTNLPGQIVKLTVQGFLVEFNLKTIKPGDKFDVYFELPVSKHSVNESCVVVKLYNQWALGTPTDAVPGSDGMGKEPKVAAQTPSPAVAPAKVAQLVECHFINVNSSSRERIQMFLNQIGRSGAK